MIPSALDVNTPVFLGEFQMVNQMLKLKEFSITVMVTQLHTTILPTSAVHVRVC
jgi:hypothetical protein